jgi:hypothetical protein
MACHTGLLSCPGSLPPTQGSFQWELSMIHEGSLLGKKRLSFIFYILLNLDLI